MIITRSTSICAYIYIYQEWLAYRRSSRPFQGWNKERRSQMALSDNCDQSRCTSVH